MTAGPGRRSVAPRRAASAPGPAAVRVVVPGIGVFVPSPVLASVVVPGAPRSPAGAARSAVASAACAQGQEGVLDLANGIRLTFRRHVCNYTFIVI